jgi:DNA-binding MarR family transcriptional regulator
MDDRFDTDNIDEIIHGRVRLGLMAYLSGVESASFAELKARTGTTDGNLSTHMRKLEDAGYVAVTKTFKGRRPLTTAAMTQAGRKAWIAYLDAMRGLLEGG